MAELRYRHRISRWWRQPLLDLVDQLLNPHQVPSFVVGQSHAPKTQAAPSLVTGTPSTSQWRLPVGRYSISASAGHHTGESKSKHVSWMSMPASKSARRLLAAQAVMPNAVRTNVKASIVENYNRFAHLRCLQEFAFFGSSLSVVSITVTT